MKRFAAGLGLALGITVLPFGLPFGLTTATAAPFPTLPCFNPVAIAPANDAVVRRPLRDTTPVQASDLAALPPLDHAPATVATPTPTPAESPAATPERRQLTQRQRSVAPSTAETTTSTPTAIPSPTKQAPATRLPRVVRIPVYVNVVRGRHKHERGFAPDGAIRRVIRQLNNGFSGGQSSLNTPTRYDFVLKRVKRVTRDGWHHAYFNGPRSKRMKRSLHRGGPRALNLYITGSGPKGQPVLGFASFPWKQSHYPRLDAVVINHKSMTNGSARGYNLGDTVVHETGHWLGLFHTFQGGCSARNDLVADTPAESGPSNGCDPSSDTCPAPGLDPVRNFMNYSPDRCINHFTPGQVARMDAAWAKWRA